MRSRDSRPRVPWKDTDLDEEVERRVKTIRERSANSPELLRGRSFSGMIASRMAQRTWGQAPRTRLQEQALQGRECSGGEALTLQARDGVVPSFVYLYLTLLLPIVPKDVKITLHSGDAADLSHDGRTSESLQNRKDGSARDRLRRCDPVFETTI